MSTSKALKELKNFTGMFKALQEVADELEKAGDFESLARTRKAEVEAIERQLIERKAAKEEIAREIAKAEENHKKLLEGAKAEVSKAEYRARVIEQENVASINEGRAAAAKVIEDAKNELQAAKERAKAIQAEAEKIAAETLAKAKADVAESQAQVVSAEKELEVVKSDVAVESRKLADLKAEIAKLRAQFA